MWFNQYPYINLTDLNLDFIYKSIKELRYQLENFININTIKYANPIQWNITTQYEANTVVIDANDGTAYLSVKPVPSGVAITNTEYWTPIFTLNLLSANQNITLRDDGSNVLATFSSNADDWLIWNNTLYKVTQAINVNEAYVVGYNLTRYTVEMFINDYLTEIRNIIGDLNDLATTDKDSIVDAINDIINNIIGDLNNLTTTDKDSVVDAINEVVNSVSEIDKGYYLINDVNSELSVQIINAINSGYNTIKIKEGVYNLTNTITLEPHQKIEGLGKVEIYCSAPTAFHLVGYTGSDYQTKFNMYAPYNGTWLKNLFIYGQLNSDIGIDFGGDDSIQHEMYNTIANCKFEELTIRHFDIGIKAPQFNFYLNKFINCFIRSCNVGVLFGYTGITAFNYGENITFESCIISNNLGVINIFAPAFEIHFNNCSLDFNERIIYDGGNYQKLFITNSHLEGIGTPSATAHGIFYATAPRVNSQLVIDGCTIHYGGSSFNPELFVNAPTTTIITNCNILTVAGDTSVIFYSPQLIIKGHNKIQDGNARLTSVANNILEMGAFNDITLSGIPAANTPLGAFYVQGYRAGISAMTTTANNTYVTGGKTIHCVGAGTSFQNILIHNPIRVEGGKSYRPNLICASNATDLPKVMVTIRYLYDDDSVKGSFILANNNITRNDGADAFLFAMPEFIVPYDVSKIKVEFSASATNLSSSEYFDFKFAYLEEV